MGLDFSYIQAVKKENGKIAFFKENETVFYHLHLFTYLNFLLEMLANWLKENFNLNSLNKDWGKNSTLTTVSS